MMFKKYLRDTSGNFAIMFSISATCLILGAAGAIDLMGLQKQKSQMQAMTDAAVLAAASTKSENIADLKKIAQASVDANNVKGENIKIHLTVVDDIINVTADQNYKAQLMGFAGLKEIPVSTISSAPILKDVPLNVALVLDRTGSMSGANMESLKSASAKLIDVFDSYDGEVRAAVVPFSNYVNVGLSNRSESWMDVPDDSTTVGTEEVCVTKRDLEQEDLCTTETATSTKDGLEFDYQYRSCPDAAYGPEYEQCYIPTSTTTWYGCAGSRDGVLHKTPAFQNKPFPGIMNTTCGEEILPLTMNISAVKDKINSLTASGNTYIPAGLIWGWRMLDSKKPFDDLSNSQKDRKRALILMSDGANTLSLNQPFHTGNDYNAANDLTAELCELIKKEGIDMFTVAYKLSDTAETKDVIRICASSEEYFFDAANTAELELAFEEIGRSLYEPRLVSSR